MEGDGVSRRIDPEYRIIPGTSVRIICTGKDTHAEVRFGKSALTEGGKVWTEINEPQSDVRDRRDEDPELAHYTSRAIDKKLKSFRFKCPQCSLDYQRRAERWREIVKVYHASDWKVLDLSKLPV